MALAHGGVELTRFRGYLITWRSTVHGTGGSSAQARKGSSLHPLRRSGEGRAPGGGRPGVSPTRLVSDGGALEEMRMVSSGRKKR